MHRFVTRSAVFIFVAAVTATGLARLALAEPPAAETAAPASTPAPAAPAAAAAIGQAAPEFTLTGIDGKAYKLSDFKGKYVVLEWNNLIVRS